MISTVCLLLPLSVTVLTDVRRHLIYNWTVYPGILFALVLSLLATLLGRDLLHGSAEDVYWWGTPPIGAALIGLLVLGFVMLVGYVFFPGGLGGGDVKLMAMIGAFLGMGDGLEVMLWTFVLGGCLGLAKVVWHVGAVTLAQRFWCRLRSVLRARSWLPLTDSEREPLQLQLYLSPAAFAAVLIVRCGLL